MFDREALQALLRGMTEVRAASGGRSARLRALARRLFLLLPGGAVTRVQSWRSSRLPFRVPPEAILLRAVVVKHFVDRLHSGVGSVAPLGVGP